jgi:hypothetical protein
MAKKFKLLLLDANIVIELFRSSLWDHVIERCDVHLSRIVLDEAQFYETDDGQRNDIELEPYIATKKITVFEMTPSDLSQFRGRFDLTYFEKLDPGETESLAYLLSHAGECTLCSADGIVYRLLGNLNLSDRGISLEELLKQIGLGRSLLSQFSQDFRKYWTAKGAQESIRDLGLKKLKPPGKP